MPFLNNIAKENNKAKRLAAAGLLAALSLIFSYIESLVPIAAGIPGIKLGLGNLAVLSGLYILNAPLVLLISITRIFLSGLLFGNLSSVLYSLAGGLLSFLIMYVFKKLNIFSQLGVSILGAVFHNIGQLSVAFLVLKSFNIFYYFPILLISGIASGALIGITCKLVTKPLKALNL